MIVMVMSTTGMTMAGTSAGWFRVVVGLVGRCPFRGGGPEEADQARAQRESTTNVASRRRRDPTVAVAGSVGPSKTERGWKRIRDRVGQRLEPGVHRGHRGHRGQAWPANSSEFTFHDMNLSVEKAEYVQGLESVLDQG